MDISSCFVFCATTDAPKHQLQSLLVKVTSYYLIWNALSGFQRWLTDKAGHEVCKLQKQKCSLVPDDATQMTIGRSHE